MQPTKVKHRWRYFVTAAGRCPVREYLQQLDDEHAAEVYAAMKDVQASGLWVARHLEGEVYEVRASARDVEYRVLFAAEGKKHRVLLALEAFKKKTQKTPRRLIELATQRLDQWRRQRRSPLTN